MKKLLMGKKKKKSGLRLASSSSTEESRARYRFAVQEYRQTVPHDFLNDGYEEQASMAEHTPRRATEEGTADTASVTNQNTTTSVLGRGSIEEGQGGLPQQEVSVTERNETLLTIPSQEVLPSDSIKCTIGDASVSDYQPPSSDIPRPYYRPRPSIVQEPEMVDATYEEHYGDAYVGAPIKYVYPSGYQSMRPRGGPWKLSIAICVLFTWLSIFIVGHCSDRIESQYANNEIDDDALVIETRWCGSHLLYVLWVMSMTTTGLACAYCSVIGYIKVRDFTVANCRSQPPGMVGKSDYYVRLGDNYDGTRPPSPSNSDGSFRSYQKTIYQSDGTPLFWGGHIYRPTQAAVHVTSR